MIQVVLRHMNGDQQEVLLSGVPRVGEFVRLQRNGKGEGSPYLVKSVTWLEGTPEPSVILVVRPHVEGP